MIKLLSNPANIAKITARERARTDARAAQAEQGGGHREPARRASK